MRIYSFSKILAFPFGLAFILILYFTMESNSDALSYWLIPPIIILAVIFVFSPQIDYWWYKDHPPPLDNRILKWLKTYSRFYESLSKEDKERFEDRLSIFMKAQDFSLMTAQREELPEDLKAIISLGAIRLTFGKEKFLFNHFNRVVAYHHAFPSPEQPILHTIETQKEDGVIILSIEQVIQGIIHPKVFYNIALHAFIEAYLAENQLDELEGLTQVDEKILNEISELKLSKIKSSTGLEELNISAVTIHHFFQFKEKFAQHLPELAGILSKYLNV